MCYNIAVPEFYNLQCGNICTHYINLVPITHRYNYDNSPLYCFPMLFDSCILCSVRGTLLVSLSPLEILLTRSLSSLSAQPIVLVVRYARYYATSLNLLVRH